MKALKDRESGTMITDPPGFSDTELRTNRRLVDQFERVSPRSGMRPQSQFDLNSILSEQKYRKESDSSAGALPSRQSSIRVASIDLSPLQIRTAHRAPTSNDYREILEPARSPVKVKNRAFKKLLDEEGNFTRNPKRTVGTAAVPAPRSSSYHSTHKMQMKLRMPNYIPGDNSQGLLSPSMKSKFSSQAGHPPSSALTAIGSYKFNSPDSGSFRNEIQGEIFLNNLQPINILPNA